MRMRKNVKKYFAASLTNNSFNTLTFNAKDKKPKRMVHRLKGYSKIEPTLTKYRNKLKSAQTNPDPTKSKQSSLWIIYQLNYKITRYVYDTYVAKRISKELYDWLLLQNDINKTLLLNGKNLVMKNYVVLIVYLPIPMVVELVFVEFLKPNY